MGLLLESQDRYYWSKSRQFQREKVILIDSGHLHIGTGLTDHGTSKNSSIYATLTTSRTSFSVQAGLGSDSQILRLLPSTSLPELYAIHPNGCKQAMAKNMTFDGLQCDISRGGIYNHNASVSYHQSNQMYDFSINAAFHDFGFMRAPGLVGLESFVLNLPNKSSSDNNSNDTLKDLLVAGISDYNFTWVGMLGLDVQGTNLSGFGGMGVPLPTMLGKMKQNKLIPSLSWAYTAGCHGCKYNQPRRN